MRKRATAGQARDEKGGWDVSTRREQGLPRRASKQNGDAKGGSNSVVESQPSKLLVAGSIPVSRSIRLRATEPTRDGVMASH